MNPTEPARYDDTAIMLHWLAAALIVCGFALGLVMTGLSVSPTRLRLFNWHKWVGVTVLAVSLLRLAWRAGHHPPALGPQLLAALPGWRLAAYRATHRLLYVLFLAVPLSGWAYSSATGFPVVWLGGLALPDFVAPDKALVQPLRTLHHGLAYALGGLALLHVAAALEHGLVERDGLLARMWPRRRRLAGGPR